MMLGTRRRTKFAISDTSQAAWIMVQQGPDPAPPQPPPPPPPPAPPAPPVNPNDPNAVARLNSQIADIRAEAAAHRIDARNATEAVTALQRQLTEAQTAADSRIAAERTTMNATLQTERQARVDAELKAAAAVSGLTDLELLPLISRSAIVVDPATGTITGIPEAIAAFKTSKPQYFRSDAPQPGPAPAPRAPGLPAPAPQPAPAQGNVRDLPRNEYEARKRDSVRRLRGL